MRHVTVSYEEGSGLQFREAARAATSAYTMAELAHLYRLCREVRMTWPGGPPFDPEELRAEARYVREHGTWGDAENCPRPSDLDQPTAAELEEWADEVECGMHRGEHLP